MISLTTMKKNHMKLWDWLAKNPSQEKWDCPLFEEICNDCWACEWVLQHIGEDWNCELHCPLNWYPAINCMRIGSVYYKWGNVRQPESRTKYAKLIRDLPLKKR